MKIGLSYDLKEAVRIRHNLPEDALEEYDSLETVEAIAAALEALGHTIVWLGGGKEFLSNILQKRVDMVFNIAEGRGDFRSREAQIPCVLEMLDIPYSGSDPQCLAICLDKPLTKKLAATEGVSTPQWLVITDIEQLQRITWNGFAFPAVVKPSHEGSSKGIRSSNRVEHVRQAVDVVTDLLNRYQQPVLVEEFVAGDEVTVGVLGNSPPRVLGIMRVLPKIRTENFIYSLEVKRDWERLVEYECPAHLDGITVQRITDASLKIFDALGCRDFARVDFRVSAEGAPYFLEINPLPGLNPRSSDLPLMACVMGVDFQELISEILDSALQRYSQ